MPYVGPASVESLRKYLTNPTKKDPKADSRESTKPFSSLPKNQVDTVQIKKNTNTDSTKNSYLKYERDAQKAPVIFPKHIFTTLGGELPPGHEWEHNKDMWVIDTKKTMPPSQKKENK